MKGIKRSDCKFYVDEEARTVVCVIPPILNDGYRVQNMLEDFIREYFDFHDISFFDAMDWGWVRENLELPYSFMGKAVCAEEDEWNEELGRKIAFSRAKDKCYQSFFKRANKFIQTVDRRLNEAMDKFNSFGAALEVKQKALQAQIDKEVKK